MEELYFEATDETKICYNKLIPKDVKVILLFSHGAGSYPGRSEELFKYLYKNKIGVYAIHHKGYGKSEGKRGHIKNFNTYITHLKELYDIAKSEGNIPNILYGHSLGALIGIRFCMKYSNLVKKLILSAPAIKFERKVPLWIRVLKRPISIIWPTFSRDTGLRGAKDDKLFVTIASARWLVEIERSQKYIMQNIDKLKTSTYIFQSKNDKLANFDATKEFYSMIQTKQKDLREEDFSISNGHEFINDSSKSNKDLIMKQIVDWIYDRIDHDQTKAEQ